MINANEIKKAFDLARSRKIVKVYSGKDDACRCGCCGRFVYASMIGGEGYISGKLRFLEKGELGEIEDVLVTDYFVNFSLPNNKALTFYFE